jgi:microcystin-dependent protein
MDGIIGEIKLVIHEFEMKDYMYCDGRTLTPEKFPALYALIGIKFGGDGHDAFNLPILEAPLPGMRYVICVNGTFPCRD